MRKGPTGRWLGEGVDALRKRLLKELPAFRTGLVARLTFAFALVLLLAIVANLAATGGGLIVRTESRTVAAVAPKVPAVVSAVAPDTESKSMRDSNRVDALRGIGEFLGALNRLERELDRSVVEQPASARELNAAMAGLSRQATLLDSKLESAWQPEVAPRLATLSREVVDNAQQLLRHAATAQQAREAYWTAIDSLDLEIRGVLDQNWKILGRIIARESLIEMSRRAEEIRRQSTQVILDGTFVGEKPAALESAQAALASQLDLAVTKNGNSKSGAWATRARTALGAAIRAREELQQIASAEKAARLQKQRLLAAIDSELERWSDQFETAARESAPNLQATPQAAPPGPSAQAALMPAGHGPISRPHVHVEEVVQAPQRKWLPWLSGAIVLALLLVCAWTIHSVVRPIKVFATSVRAFARGETSVRFAPAGIRELDVLAEAFNRMTQELTQAQSTSRHYQTELEQRVHERTQALQHLADHDPLTSLPNRRQLTCYLDLALEKAARAGMRVAVFFLDLDNFKIINDSMGHAYGDLVLQAIAQRLRQALPAGAFAGRLGGDEFTVIVEAETSEQILSLGQGLSLAFQKPHIIGDRELVVGVSLGASLYPDHATEAAALLRAADAALFSAKSAGRSRLAMFHPALLEAASLKFRIEQGLRRAVERGEFELLFQPEVSFGQLQMPLVEALLRWRQPDGTCISPGEFLAVAEDSGLIMTISDWVVRAAVEQAAIWYHGPWPEARVAINVSARQLLDAQFDERLGALLDEYALPASCIELELTENVLQTGVATIEMLQRLRARGIAVALDDFGAGYSSLASLEQLPLTRVKLDRSLIAEIDREARSLSIARAIITLCRELGLEVTAEGVERSEQLALLAEEPGVTLQGYLLHAPISAADIPALLAATPGHLQSLLLSLPARPAGPATNSCDRSTENAGEMRQFR